MAETSVKNETCQHCGADVRLNSQFCYNCGGSVTAETGFKDLPHVESNNGDASKQTSKLELAEPSESPILEPTIQEEPVLKSAATMRRKSKVIEPKKVEVIWEEHENASGGWFILAALVLTLFAVGVFYLASYLK